MSNRGLYPGLTPKGAFSGVEFRMKGAANGNSGDVYQSGSAEIFRVGAFGNDNWEVQYKPSQSTPWASAVSINKTTGKLNSVADSTSWRQGLYAAPFDALAYSGMQVNGSMEVDQMRASALNVGVNGYAIDGVQVQKTGTMVVDSQQVGVVASTIGFAKALKITVTTAQAVLGASDSTRIIIPIEGYRVNKLQWGFANASPVTIGFFVQANRIGTYSGSVRPIGAGRSYPFSFSIGIANTWEFKTVTIPGDTAGSWWWDSTTGIVLAIAIAAGTSIVGTSNTWASADYIGVTGTTNGVAATSDTFQITGVIVLPGTELPAAARMPFIMRSFDQEIILARRYWWSTFSYGVVPAQNLGLNTGELVNSSFGASLGVRWNLQFNPMRINPTITTYNIQAANAQVRDSSAAADGNSTSATNISTAGVTLVGITPAGSAIGNRVNLHASLDSRM